jgi:hypothetical protein
VRRGTAFLLLGLAAAGCGSAARTTTNTSIPTIRKAIVARLRTEQVDYRWIACVRNGRRYRGLPIVRCNVNVGMDPHADVYCAVVDRGRVVTNHENGAIPCGHDDAGRSVPSVEGS